MFNNKKDVKKGKDTPAAADDGLIVHNMPKVSASASGFYDFPMTSPAAGNQTIERPEAKTNSKKIGLLIMIGGVITIAILIYLSYRFMISPSLKNPPSLENDTVTPATETPLIETVTSTPEATDLSTSSPAVVDQATSTIATTTEVVEDQNSLFLDADGDGLNDNEEMIIGSSATSTDTDADGYSDYAEMLSGYDPASGGKISVNANLSTEQNDAFNYQILRPKDWTVQSVNNGATLIFTAPDNSLIQIAVQDNPDQASIQSWYEDSFPGTSVSYDKVRNTYSWEGIMGENGLNFYLTDKGRKNIYIISYIPAVDGRVAYPTIFQAMINSMFIN